MNMFRVESYVAPILLSYVDKYVQNFNPANAQLSIWSGDVVLQNLVLKTEVLQHELSLPFTLVSGRIHELHIQVPWTKLVVEPIIVTINTMECILTLNGNQMPRETPVPESPRSTPMEAPPGYMQALVRRIVSNISLRVQHLIVKYVHDDIVLSLNINDMAIDSAGSNWKPAFADIDPAQPLVRRVMHVEELTLCLDRTEADGKIRIFQEPLLCRCSLDFRVLTRLVSASSRRASSVSVQVWSRRLAWSVNSEQLVLLFRLLREQPEHVDSTPLAQFSTDQVQTNEGSSDPSWTQWAWSWVPTWLDSTTDLHEQPLSPTPCPFNISVFIDEIILNFKILSPEINNRRNADSILELVSSHVAMKCLLCNPTFQSIKIGVRSTEIRSQGACVCGHVRTRHSDNSRTQKTVYLYKLPLESSESDESWSWPEDAYNDMGDVDVAEIIDEGFRVTPEPEGSSSPRIQEQTEGGVPDGPENTPPSMQQNEIDPLFKAMGPLIYLEYSRERSPQNDFINPYDNPPQDFEYSDWTEECSLKMNVEPIELRLCMSLYHRLNAIKSIIDGVPTLPEPEVQVNVLTVEECDALQTNLPQQRISIDLRNMRIRVIPWDHSLIEASRDSPLILVLDVPKATINLTCPLYPQRVCAAACQLPTDNNLLYQAARINILTNNIGIEAKICSDSDTQTRPCGRMDIRVAMHFLLHKHLFQSDVITHAVTFKIGELNVCGSMARLSAACHVVDSNIRKQTAFPLKYTTLARDALNDEEAVAIDMNIEDIAMRGYLTKNSYTFISTVQSARATAFHALNNHAVKQAWIFSAPDSPSATSYFRLALQWCNPVTIKSLDYMGVWIESTSVSMDPLFVSWLAYEPRVNEEYLARSKQTTQSSTTLRRPTPSSSSGRGASRSASVTELVHAPSHSRDSHSEPDKKERDEKKPQPQEDLWSGARLVMLHNRLRNTLFNVEVGLVLLYATDSSASAVDCVTLRDAMERHVVKGEKVVVFCLGRLSLSSNMMMKFLWNELRHDGPTYLVLTDTNAPKPETFPWKVLLSDMSCYLLEVYATRKLRDIKAASVSPKTMLELVTSTLTLSVITKRQELKTKHERKRHVTAETSKQDHLDQQKLKYFTSGTNFKPSNLKDFVRGPKRGKSDSDESERGSSPEEKKVIEGPVVSIGVHIHIDTPPINVKLNRNELNMVSAMCHLMCHVVSLLSRPRMVDPRPPAAPHEGNRSVGVAADDTQMDDIQSQSTLTEPHPLVSIYEAKSAEDISEIKSFLWLQWVISRATAVVDTYFMKLALEMDDIITSVDLQKHYTQMKFKISSASLRHYKSEAETDNWVLGALGGQILEVREPNNALENHDFFSVTLTTASIGSIHPNMREDLHPKLLQNQEAGASVTEIFATLAPLEAVLLPTVCANILAVLREVSKRSYCPLTENSPQQSVNAAEATQWPFAYFNFGGMRVLLTDEDEVNQDSIFDDAIIFNIERASLTPHPENPISRRLINLSNENLWKSAGRLHEGRQYELILKSISVQSSQFAQIVEQAERVAEVRRSVAGENPAYNWSRHRAAPTYTHVLDPLDASVAFAPALFSDGALCCGPALEVNLLSRCVARVSLEHITIVTNLFNYLSKAYNKYFFLGDPCYIREKVNRPCPFITLLKRHLPPPQLENTQAGNLKYAQVVIGPANYSVHCPIHHRPMAKRETDSGAGTESNTDNETESFMPRRRQPNHSRSNFEHTQVDPWNYVEIYMSMSTINLAIYTRDDSSHEAIHLRVPKKYFNAPEPIVEDKEVTPEVEESKEEMEKFERIKLRRSSLDDNEKDPDMENNLEDNKEKNSEDEFVQDTQDVTRSHRDSVDNVRATMRTEEKAQEIPKELPKENHVYVKLPLLHVKLEEQNMYYWRSNTQINFKVSLFDVRVALAGGTDEGAWNDVILSTKKGEAESDTEIPPGVASLNILVPVAGSTAGANSAQLNRGSIHLDLERPTMIEVSQEKLVRMGRVINLIRQRMSSPWRPSGHTVHISTPFLNKLRVFMMNGSVESVTVRSTQIGVRGTEGAIGCTYSSLQIANCARPERMTGRGLLKGLVVSSGAPFNPRHVILQPTILGLEWEAKFKSWQSADSDVTLSASVALDRAVFDVRPQDLDALGRIITTAGNFSTQVLERRKKAVQPPIFQQDDEPQPSDLLPTDLGDHYYKDDLRSGAFQLVRGNRIPLAYQVMLHHDTVTWQYPHPRAITTLVAYPLPDLEENVACVLELFNDLPRKWEGHTRFTIPTGTHAEYHVAVSSMGVYGDAVYATLWRVRVCNGEDDLPKSETEDFDFSRYISTGDSQDTQKANEKVEGETSRGDTKAKVSGDLLSGVLRVDSHFAPNNLPKLKIGLKAALVELNVHNALPCTDISIGEENVKGYYISEPLVRSHRTLTVMARDTNTNLYCAAHSRGLFNITTHISGEILNCESGTMETCLNEVRVQAGATLPLWDSSRRLRVHLSQIKLSFDLFALRTVQTLFEDWRPSIYMFFKSQVATTQRFEGYSSSSDLASRLEGRVFMLIQNTCSSELRFGQVDTTETVGLEPHCKIAYRWCSPRATKKLRFTIVDPTDEKKWSDGVSLKPGESRVVLRGMETLAARSDVHLLVKVEDIGAMRHVTLAGRIVLANLLYMNVSIKVRVRPSESQSWYNVTGGRLAPETVNTSVLCGTDTEAVLKIKVASGDNGWSGDIPFKESPKEHIPWLIKLPRDGDAPITLWCRVVRLRADSRILVSLWPLYMLRSYLTLDAEVLIKTDEESSTSSASVSQNPQPPAKAPELMPVSGQGTTTQLFMCGSVNTKYTLSFKYKNVARSVTTDVPLHYATTSPSVFELVTPFNSIEDLIDDINKWISRSGRQGDPMWPLSAVSSHWPRHWTPGAKQPRSDVVVRYVPVRVANGCSLELHVAPLVMVCNAAFPALSIFDADCRLMCRVLPGTFISPPTTLLKEPFHISLNKLANLTYSGLPLRVWDREPGQYGRPPLGCIALDYDNEIALFDKNKVRLVTIIYELKENINIFGITHTYAMVNKLRIPILIGAVVIPQVRNGLRVLTAPTYVNIEPVTHEGSEPIEWYSLEGKWPGPGTDPSELIPYVLLTSHWAAYNARLPVPVRLSGGPLRQPIAVHRTKGEAFPAVVSVVSSERRWIVTVERDPCPQFVVHNHTLFDLVVAEAKVTHATEPSTSAAEPLPERVGVQWWCAVESKSYTPFSTPTYTGRYPSKQNEQHKDSGTYLSFAKISCARDDMETGTTDYLSSLKWSPPVAVTNGEQLMQLGTGQLIKMRVLMHLHSSLIELREVNQKDISASEIRRRIFETDADDKLPRLGGHHDVLLDQTSAEPPSEDHAACLLPPDSKPESSVSLITPQGLERLEDGNVWLSTAQFLSERLRVNATGIVLQMAASPDAPPLLAVHLDRPTVHLQENSDGFQVTASVSNFQVDNLQYEGGQFDFPVVLSTRAAEGRGEPWPLLWNMFMESNVESNENEPSLLLITHHQRWADVDDYHCQLSNVEARFGPISLYVEDPFVSALLELARRLTARADSAASDHTPSVRHPLLLQTLLIHPLDLQLTLHTALRMYIALDQSPLRLNAFECHDLMTSPDRLMHALTVHYLSAALLSAGWVVGGLELLGAPGALAARVSAASGGVRGVASAAAAALLKSVSAWAGSLARNLDLLAGDQEHARRAAAARRRPPPNLVAGLGAGVSNFAINLLGAIGGLAHHPVVGVAVGDNDSTTGLRRGLVGALAKPLSATADLFAYAGHGLLQQTGWDLLPSRRPVSLMVAGDGERWRRECVRLSFQMSDAPLVAGFDVQINGVLLYLLLTHKYMVLVEPKTDRFREMIDVNTLELMPYRHGRPVKLSLREEVTKEKERGEDEATSRSDDEEQARQMSATALERVARYTGAEASAGGRRRKRAIELHPAAGQGAALHTVLSALIQHSTDTHFPLL